MRVRACCGGGCGKDSLLTHLTTPRAAQGVGVGHSWWSEQMCAGDNAEAVDVLLTEVSNKRIVVDEQKLTAKVDAGVILHDFLDYISLYGRGYTTGNFPWFTFQTVGGAVATGSHGSSMTYGSLSSDDMLLALDVVLANGALPCRSCCRLCIPCADAAVTQVRSCR